MASKARYPPYGGYRGCRLLILCERGRLSLDKYKICGIVLSSVISKVFHSKNGTGEVSDAIKNYDDF